MGRLTVAYSNQEISRVAPQLAALHQAAGGRPGLLLPAISSLRPAWHFAEAKLEVPFHPAAHTLSIGALNVTPAVCSHPRINLLFQKICYVLGPTSIKKDITRTVYYV